MLIGNFMKNENQNIEWKENWRDEYLKWVCGFANANGGKIYIGKDDSGNVIHLPNYDYLMNTIPNKIRNLLGIICDVNLLIENKKNYIEIIIPPYSVPVSLRGRYYYRSGSTKTELTGNSLNEFLLKKAGKTWDDVVEEGATLNDIDTESLSTFLKDAEKSGRMPDVSNLSNEEILDKLRLLDNGRLKRAAIILFAKDPNRFFPNIMVKIGAFSSNNIDLEFQEVEENNLIKLLPLVQNQLNHKFLKKNISFEGFQRIEKGEYPVAAIREMILNALVHRTYMGAAVQIRVYNNKISIWNEGGLPESISLDSLKQIHASHPRNPRIADVCFKAGYIDAWGRGTLKIIETCKNAALPEPEIIESDGGILVTLFKDKYTIEILKQTGLNERQIKAVEYVKENGKITNTEYQTLNKISKPTATRDLLELVEQFKLFKKIGKVGRGTVYKL